MKTLILTVGLPRSGKSTWAIGTGYPVVNRDSIRLALHGQAYIQEAEHMISSIEYLMVKSLFLAGHYKVIVDATHLKEKYITAWKSNEWNLELHFLDTPKDVCIDRAIKNEKEYLIPIIEKMYDEADEIIFHPFRNNFIKGLQK